MSLIIEAGRQLRYSPRFSLEERGIIVGPYKSAQEYDRHVATTLGSGGVSGFGEAIRFERQSGLLASVWVHVSEHFDLLPSNLDAWLSGERRVGLPRLSGTPREVDWPSALAIDPNGNYIAGLVEPISGREHRLLVAPDFELLVAEEMIGWLLHSPAQYLSVGWESAEQNGAWMHLAPLLSRFLLTVDSELVLRLEANEEGAREELVDLLGATVAAPPSAQRAALVRAIESVLSIFENG